MEINNSEEIPISTNEINTLNQNFPEVENIDQNKEKKSIKFDENTVSVIPIQEAYNLRYGDNLNEFKELDSQTKNLINDPKYADEKRSKSAFSKKSFREKYEPLKIKVPTNREWNRDPTAEIIIHNLEQKIDILTYENFLLSKKLREIENSNKELKLNISQNLMLMKAEQEINNEENKKKYLKNEMNKKNKDNIDNKKIKKNNKKDKKEKDVDLFEEINRVKDENDRLRLSNQNLAENNAELNKVIETLKNEINLNKENSENNYDEKYKFGNDNIDNNKEENNINNEQIEKNQNINLDNININNDNNLANIINNSDEKKMQDEQNNSEVDMNKFLQSEEQYHDLIEENELLHKKLRSLLSIEKDPNINLQNSISKEKNINNISLKNKKDNQKDEISKENYILKQKIRALNGEINRMAVENNRKILIIQQKLEEYETKQRENLLREQNKLGSQNEIEKKRKEEELDEILNETLLVMDRNQEDEESRKMIETVKNIKNEQKKRISQCLIINNKLKSLLQENEQLHNQLLLSKKENDIINNTNSNFNKTNTSNMNNNNSSNANPHICFCGSGNFSVNALKIKDEMIIKYKDKIDENNEILKLTQNSNNSNNSNNNRNNELNFIEKDYNIASKYKKEKNDGFEDYLLGKIVNNQKEVLGERAPRFYENNNINNNKYVAKSMQYDDGNKMNNRYNNYHYRGRIMEDDE